MERLQVMIVEGYRDAKSLQGHEPGASPGGLSDIGSNQLPSLSGEPRWGDDLDTVFEEIVEEKGFTQLDLRLAGRGLDTTVQGLGVEAVESPEAMTDHLYQDRVDSIVEHVPRIVGVIEVLEVSII